MFVEKLKNAFTLERVLCRLFAAWFAFASLILLLNGEDFFSLSYAQNVSFGILVLSVLAFFALFSCLAYFCGEYAVDSWVLLLFSFVCCCYWSLACEDEENAFLTAEMSEKSYKSRVARLEACGGRVVSHIRLYR